MNVDTVNYLYRRLAVLEERVAKLEADARPKPKPEQASWFTFFFGPSLPPYTLLPLENADHRTS